MEMADIKTKLKSQQEIVDRILKYLAVHPDNSAGENEIRDNLKLQDTDMDILGYMLGDGLIFDWEDIYNAKAVERAQYALTAKGEQEAKNIKWQDIDENEVHETWREMSRRIQKERERK